ncbi:hypothetical protein, partial [Alloalcanivorax xenomutans]|uniref:hypothetical protein n=1 Tax=Alloalcanivorax xenomutans TaxID=1094342 RepID=UPI0011AB1E56
MKERFAKPPLLELVAEIRWQLPRPFSGHDMPMPMIPQMLKVYEDGFSHFSKSMAEIGFRNSERLVPQGFPSMPYEPVLRYRFDESSPD